MAVPYGRAMRRTTSSRNFMGGLLLSNDRLECGNGCENKHCQIKHVITLRGYAPFKIGQPALIRANSYSTRAKPTAKKATAAPNRRSVSIFSVQRFQEFGYAGDD